MGCQGGVWEQKGLVGCFDCYGFFSVFFFFDILVVLIVIARDLFFKGRSLRFVVG